MAHARQQVLVERRSGSSACEYLSNLMPKDSAFHTPRVEDHSNKSPTEDLVALGCVRMWCLGVLE